MQNMNPNLNEVTRLELFNDLFTDVGYKNFIPRYRSLLLRPDTNLNKKTGSHGDSALIESAAAEVAQLLPQAFGIFRLITAKPNGQGEEFDYITTQKALHEYMIKTLYHINRNCRALLEAQVHDDNYDSIESYLRVLKRKYRITDGQMLVALQKWHEPDEAIFYNLVEREAKLKVFDTETAGVCFQIYDEKGDEVLQVLDEMRTDNGLAISKRYFFFRIFQVFQHLYLSTQLCELDKTGVATLENIEMEEVGTEFMDAFNQTAKESL